MQAVTVEKMAEDMKLESFTPCVNAGEITITSSDVNRPGLELSGFFEHFASDRVQILGNVECSYLEMQCDEHKANVYEKLLGSGVPCVIFCRGFAPDERFRKIAGKYGVPLLGTERGTSDFMSRMIHYLQGKLAPSISIHGVLVDVYGEGLLITGESGIGKSEAALELVRRGHRLVTDDVVEIRNIGDGVLVGTSPEITRYFIELRGIGIINVKTLFGVECVKEEQNIDLVIKLEEWDQHKQYDRLGLEEEYTEILGQKVVCHSIPIRPGRNLAVICEAAAVNHRQKKMGYNAAQELYGRIQENLVKGMKESEQEAADGGKKEEI